MIHGVSANHASFHSVAFTPGLNVILADRSQGATAKDTRNGVGKSTLIEIIDFCLGSRAVKGKGLIIPALAEWAFTLDITLGGRRVQVTRTTAQANYIEIQGSTNDWPEQPEADGPRSNRVYRVERWRSVLGRLLFALPPETSEVPYHPSYRSLVSYFLRRGPDAYSSPFRHFRQQKTWDVQLHTSYLMGMNWEYAARWQYLKDQVDGITAIEKAVATGVMAAAVGTIGELETQRIQLEQRGARLQESLSSFRVHPEYESLQDHANVLTDRIHELTNRGVVLKRTLARYKDAIADVASSPALTLERVYEDVQVYFPATVRRTLEDAREFHENILANRKEFLAGEIVRIEGELNAGRTKLGELAEERAGTMNVLNTHGAFAEFARLQEQHLAIQESLGGVRTRLGELRGLADRKRDAKLSKVDLARTAVRDHEERREVWSHAVRLFNENSEALYKSPGTLVIEVGDTGYKFRVEIERSGSEGIERMKIFCFDLAVLEVQREMGRGIDFLVHDTLMFDAVDPRQRALALERAHEVTIERGAQYICALNSDMVPRQDFTQGFDINGFVRLRLSDASENERLLGIRFDRPGKS